MLFSSRRFRWIALGAFAALMLSSTLPTAAFWPTNFRSFFAGGDAHEVITERAVESLYFEFFGVTEATDPMEDALDEIVDGNAQTDALGNYRPPEHFDSEMFEAGQSFVVAKADQVVRALEVNDTASARAALGTALHAVQDFYSHSNWIELGNTAPSQTLGRDGSRFSNLAARNETTCSDCTIGTQICADCTENLITPRLTSGYFSDGPGRPPEMPPRKCSHGGRLDSTAPSDKNFGINKDVLNCNFSPHSHLHDQAAALATSATRQYIRDLAARLTARQLRQLFGVGPVLVFAIDTTQSMEPIIDGLKARTAALVDERIGTAEEPSKYVLVPFNDPNVETTLTTGDPEVFKRALDQLDATGGGDCPEPAYAAVEKALALADAGSDIFLYTNGSAKDPENASGVFDLAAKKDAQFWAFSFGSCFGARSGQRASLGSEPTSIDRILGEGDFEDLALATGGQVFRLDDDEASAITALADFVVRSNAVEVLSIAGTASEATAYPVPVDSEMSALTLAFSGSSAPTLRRPDGTPVADGDPSVTVTSFDRSVIQTIAAPAPGIWTVEVEADAGDFFLNVAGESRLDLSSFDFVELSGRPGHEGYFPIPGFPVLGEPALAAFSLSGAPASVELELRTKDFRLLDTVTPERGNGQEEGELSAEIATDHEDFLVYAVGTDMEDRAFRRVVPAQVRPATLRLVAPPGRELRPGESTTYQVEVINLGPADDFIVTASDDRGFLTGISPTELSLGRAESGMVAVQLSVPEGTGPSTDVLTVRAESRDDPTLSNFAVITSPIRADDAGEPCVAGPEVLCLDGDRFRVEIDWRDDDGNAGAGRVAATSGSDESGLFYFYQSGNWEVLVKVLDGCGYNGHYWVFSAATTNVEYTLRVTDTESGMTRQYVNPLGNSKTAMPDSRAFSTCP